jgi:hypothetical protein
MKFLVNSRPEQRIPTNERPSEAKSTIVFSPAAPFGAGTAVSPLRGKCVEVVH